METTQARLIAALREAFPTLSQAEIARRAGLSQQRFNNYANGQRRMDDDAVIGCATLLGWNVQDTVAQHRADSAETDRARRFWRRLGAAAAVAGFALVLPAEFLADSMTCALAFPGLPIMSIGLAVAVAAGLWLSARLENRKCT